MKIPLAHIAALGLLFTGTPTLTAGSALADLDPAPDVDVLLGDASDPDRRWEFAVTPYLWAASISGTVGIGNIVGDIDKDFGDLVENLEFGTNVTATIRRGRWGLVTDVGYMRIGADFDRDNGVFTSGSTETESLYFFAMPYYRLIDTDRGWLEAGVGAVHYHLENELDVTGAGGGTIGLSRSDSWWDALAGIRGRYNINERYFLHGELGIGGGSSDLLLNTMVGIGYQINENVSAILAYRYLKYDYEDNGLIYDTETQGLGIGFTFSW